jgi:hypothetical protein
VAAAGQQFEAAARGCLVLCLGQDAAAAGDHGIAGKDMTGKSLGGMAGSGQRLLAGHARGIVARQLALAAASRRYRRR